LVEQWLEVQWVGKALQYANKKEMAYVVIVGKEEKEKWIYKIKNMKTGNEESIKYQVSSIK
jgi:histidyl-tRNA synthetase